MASIGQKRQWMTRSRKRIRQLKAAREPGHGLHVTLPKDRRYASSTAW